MDVKQCRDCKRPISFAAAAGKEDGEPVEWIPLDAAPVAEALKHSATCWAISGAFAHRPRDLVERLMIRRHIGEEEAQELSRQDFPWHTTHHCKENTE